MRLEAVYWQCYQQAYVWLSIAVVNDLISASTARDLIANNLTSEERAEGPGLASRYLEMYRKNKIIAR